MKNLRNEIYQEMHGFKVLKRDYTPKGKSKWYYIDPRYDNDNDQRREIEVSDENMPNPRLNAILADDIRENPQNYYIWRTCKDDKVRGKHAEREGKVFNKHIPPVGGNPGEDYNCRCWAEPYDTKEYADKPMIIDVSGLEMFKDLKSVDFNTKGFPQYAANDKATTATDAVFRKNNSVLTEEKFHDIIDFLRSKDIEGFTNFPYLDSVGKDTICTGHLITEKERYNLPYYMADTGKPATQAEIKQEFDKLHKYTEYQKNAKNTDKLLSHTFAKVTKLRLTDDQCNKIDRKIIEAKWNELVEKFPNFTIMDWNLQRAIFDVHYQNNVMAKAEKEDKNHSFGKYIWKNLWLSAFNKDINGIADNVHIRDNNKSRNGAKIQFVLQGKFYEK